MNDPSNKQNHVTISEEDVSVILQRYTATAVLGLLQEVAQVQDAKIDWNLLAKRTSTGITNARKYQMLWRHLAYRDELVDKVEDEVKPLMRYSKEPHNPDQVMNDEMVKIYEE